MIGARQEENLIGGLDKRRYAQDCMATVRTWRGLRLVALYRSNELFLAQC
jgi:hypothetical protein